MFMKNIQEYSYSNFIYSLYEAYDGNKIVENSIQHMVVYNKLLQRLILVLNYIEMHK